MNPTTDYWLTGDTQKARNSNPESERGSFLNFSPRPVSDYEQADSTKSVGLIRLLSIQFELGEHEDGQITGKRSTSSTAFQQPENYRNETLNACYEKIISTIVKRYMSLSWVCIYERQ